MSWHQTDSVPTPRGGLLVTHNCTWEGETFSFLLCIRHSKAKEEMIQLDFSDNFSVKWITALEAKKERVRGLRSRNSYSARYQECRQVDHQEFEELVSDIKDNFYKGRGLRNYDFDVVKFNRGGVRANYDF